MLIIGSKELHLLAYPDGHYTIDHELEADCLGVG